MSTAMLEREVVPPRVTSRQMEIWALVAEGLTNRQIAAHLFVSEKTVKNHVTALLASLGCQNRSQAAVAFARKGLPAPIRAPGRPLDVAQIPSPRRPMLRLTTNRDMVTSREARQLAAALLAAADAVDAAERRRYQGVG